MPELGGPQLSRDDIVAVLRRQQAHTDLSDEELGIFADAQLRTRGSAARAALASYTSTNQLIIARSKILQARTTISMALTSAEKNTVRTTFPERDFTFTDMERHDHGLAAAMRKVDRSILRERLPLRGSVLDVGGDYVYNIITEEHPIHACCPTVDPKDQFRQVERNRRLQQLVRNPTTTEAVRNRVSGFLNDAVVREKWMCGEKTETCVHAVDHLVMTHVYDMTLENVARALRAHGAKTVSGCVILASDMLERDEGDLPSVNGWYRLDRNADTMTYGTKQGSSWHYKHKWSELRRYLHDSVIVVDGFSAAYRVTEVRGQTIYFELWPIERREVLVDQPRRAYQVTGGPWAHVKGYRFVAERGGLAVCRPRPCGFRYPWETWSRAMEYARGQIANRRFTLEDYARKMRTMTAKITINSVSVAGVEAIDESQFADFLANSALAALYEVEKEKTEVQVAVSSIQARREIMGPWARTVQGFTALVRSSFSGGTDWYVGLCTRLKMTLLDRVHTVTFEYDDGSRVATVSQFPSGVHVIGPAEKIHGADDDDDDHPTAAVCDLMTAACMRDPELAARMRQVLDASMQAPPEGGSEEYSQFVAGLANVVSGAEDRDDLERGAGPESAITDTAQTLVADTTTRVDHIVDVNQTPEFHMEPVAGQDQTVARAAAATLGVDDLIPSDELGVFQFDVDVANAYYKDAMVEAIRLYHAEERRAASECLSTYLKTSIGGRPDKHLLNLLQGDAMKPDYYDIVDGKIDGSSYMGYPSALFAHSAIYLPAKMTVYRVEVNDGVVSIPGMSQFTGLGLVIQDLEVFNGPEIRDAIATARERFDIRNFTIVIRDGVPGCGKTTQIIRGARYDDLILASGKENTNATRKKKIDLDRELAAEAARTGVRFVPFQNPARRIRTYDSYLMSRIFERAEVVHADECFMQHSGKLMAAAVLSGARRIEFHGDTQQVPYVNRHTEEKCLHARLIYRHLHVNRYISHRCPQDAVAAIAVKYGYKIRTTSKVVNSLSISTSVPMDAVPWDRTKKYLTLYQDDKASAAKKCYRGGVNTVAESQGETYDHVVFVRQQARKQDLYDTWPYILVGLSRHTKTMEYLAPSATSSVFEKQILMMMQNEEYCRQFGDLSSAGRPTVMKL